MSTPGLPAHWQFYADRACETHRGRTDDFGQGQEELLFETLAVIEAGLPFTDECRQSLERLPQNRAKKHRRLRLHLANRLRLGCAFVESENEQSDDRWDMEARLSWVRAALPPTEYQIENRLSHGETYADIAPDYHTSPDALKVRASRWRAKVRRGLPAIA